MSTHGVITLEQLYHLVPIDLGDDRFRQRLHRSGTADLQFPTGAALTDSALGGTIGPISIWLAWACGLDASWSCDPRSISRLQHASFLAFAPMTGIWPSNRWSNLRRIPWRVLQRVRLQLAVCGTLGLTMLAGVPFYDPSCDWAEVADAVICRAPISRLAF